MTTLNMAARFQLAAALDRIAHGAPDVIYEADARAVLALAPAPTSLGCLLRSLPVQVAMSGRTGGRGLSGHAPGQGDVTLREEGRQFHLAPGAGLGVRAGQWHACRIDTVLDRLRGRQVIEVRQVLTTVLDVGTTFRLHFRRCTPHASELLLMVLERGAMQVATFRPWKVIVPGEAPRSDAIDTPRFVPMQGGLERRAA